MTAVRKVMITTLLLYSLTSQGKVYSVVLMKDNTRSITCNVPGQENEIVWYKYEVEYFKTERNNMGKTYSVPSEGGIFSCDEKQTTDVSCKSHNIFIILDITGDNANLSGHFTKRIGQNISFLSEFRDNGSYTLLWVVNKQKCIFSAAATRSVHDFNFSLNQLCCPSDDIKFEERVQFRNLTPLIDPNQTVHLDLFNLTSSDSGEYLCLKYSWDKGSYKWKILNKYTLEVTLDEGPASTLGTSFYIIAGSIGGVIAVLAILLLSIFCIKHRGEQMNMQRSSPVDLPDEYECTPYAVSGQKEEINNCVYSLVQNPRPATEAEYSEVQLTKPAISGASGEHKYDF
ncbi:uncharacterized protein LOC122927660 isoform X1 [Bufo gargarizans]|uniref:uncharacterized protein LOC122927660 isoform X1 n=1 Tax=Bufo gargarizans TaxID=30331 RepID=UPI001CF37874|nr:uncharacterized protein LOC122927660 isoform X1 [Bufo gargarizans]